MIAFQCVPPTLPNFIWVILHVLCDKLQRGKVDLWYILDLLGSQKI